MSLSKKELLKLSKTKLVKECKKRKIPINGSKADMIERILQKANNTKNSKPTSKAPRKDKSINDNKPPRVTICNFALIKDDHALDFIVVKGQIKPKNIAIKGVIKGQPPKTYPILLKSPKLIDPKIRKQLIKSIKPLQNNLYNYRDEQFINSVSNKEKPKLQEIISQFQYYRQYKQLTTLYSPPNDQLLACKDDIEYMNGISDRYMPIGLAPTIFSLKEYKFMTEINGLLYKSNVTLYAIIENIFLRFIPMFEWCLGIKIFDKYQQLSVIIKIQDYQFMNENKIETGWHCEGDEDDHIIAVGLYYFHVTSNDALEFKKNYLEMAKKYMHLNNSTVKIEKNDCVVFRNSTDIKHHAIISTKNKSKTSNKESISPISRKMLSFFLLDPNNEAIANQNAKDFNWINFPGKVEIFIRYFLNYNMDIVKNIYEELISLISVFSFGDDKYQRGQLTEFRIKTESEHKPNYGHPFPRKYVSNFKD